MKPALFLLPLSLVPLALYAQSPCFSHSHGFYDAPFSIQITDPSDTLDLENCHIRYTLDGSAPTALSTLYSEPLQITGNTLLRAVYERADTLVGPATTATYLFMDDVLTAPDVPSGYPKNWGPFIQSSGTAPGDYGMDPEIAQNAQLKSKVIEGLESLPVLSIVTDKDHFFKHSRDSVDGGIYIYTGPPVGDKTGRDWVRPISVEFFGDELDLTADCGIKIHGGHSRLSEKTPKHSFRLMFKEKYGATKKLKGDIFALPGAHKFEQLTLRCMFGNTWTHWTQEQRLRSQYTRDMWMRNMQRQMGYPSARGRYMHLYLNGMYWGIYCVTERVNDYYCQTNFGGDKEQYDVIKVDEELGEKVVAAEGTIDKWYEMLDVAKQAATSNQAYFQLIGCDAEGNPSTEVETLLDIDNFIDYMLLNQYGGNDDWDKHNWMAFRNREDSTQGFQLLCWDSEIIFTTEDYNALGKDTKECPSRILKHLVSNPNFLHRYYDHIYRHLEAPDGLLTPDRVVETWDSLYAIVEMPLWAESARWGDYRRDVHKQCNTLFRPDKDFQTERKRLIEKYFPNRTATLLSQLRQKGWYTSVKVPRVKVNNSFDQLPDTLHYGDLLQIQKSNTIIYTLDGSDPVTWATTSSGKTTATAQYYQAGYNLLDEVGWSAEQLTLRAITRQNTQYSATAQWTFVLDHSDASIHQISIDSQTQDDAIYDLQGRLQTLPLSPGIYMRQGKKFIVYR